jgi:hypothetical protein
MRASPAGDRRNRCPAPLPRLIPAPLAPGPDRVRLLSPHPRARTVAARGAQIHPPLFCPGAALLRDSFSDRARRGARTAAGLACIWVAGVASRAGGPGPGPPGGRSMDGTNWRCDGTLPAGRDAIECDMLPLDRSLCPAGGAQAYILGLAVAATVRESHRSIALLCMGHGMAWPEFLGTSTCGGSGGFDLDPPFRLRSIFVDFLSPAGDPQNRIDVHQKWSVTSIHLPACRSAFHVFRTPVYRVVVRS